MIVFLGLDPSDVWKLTIPFRKIFGFLWVWLDWIRIVMIFTRMLIVPNERRNLLFLGFYSIDYVFGLFEKFFRAYILFLEHFQMTFFFKICLIYCL